MPSFPRRRILQSIDDQDNYVLQIDNSTLETYVTCPRSYEFGNIHGRTPEPKSALVFGSAIHRGLELYYKARPNSEIIHAILSEFPVEDNSFASDLGLDGDSNEWRTPELAVETVLEYMVRYPRDRESWSLMNFAEGPAVEIAFSLPLLETKINALCPWPQNSLVVGAASPDQFHINTLTVFWTGKMDLLVQSRGDSGIWVMDHKTSSIAGGQFLNDFLLSQQTLGYTWAAREMLGITPHGFILDLIMNRKPTRTGTSRDFGRYPYAYPEWKLTEWRNDVQAHIVKLLHDLFDRNFPKNPKWCVGKYGLCPYSTVCNINPEDRLNALQGSGFADNIWSPLNDHSSPTHI